MAPPSGNRPGTTETGRRAHEAQATAGSLRRLRLCQRRAQTQRRPRRLTFFAIFLASTVEMWRSEPMFKLSQQSSFRASNAASPPLSRGLEQFPSGVDGAALGARMRGILERKYESSIARFSFTSFWSLVEIGTADESHSCDHTWCCNPNHVHEKTPRQNFDEEMERGLRLSGDSHPLAKITSATVHKIVSLLGQGKSDSEIALAMGVFRSKVWAIRNGVAWSKVSGISKIHSPGRGRSDRGDLGVARG